MIGKLGEPNARGERQFQGFLLPENACFELPDGMGFKAYLVEEIAELQSAKGRLCVAAKFPPHTLLDTALDGAVELLTDRSAMVVRPAPEAPSQSAL
ncbi:MAG TPA: hypothetical protein P5555_10485 [Candidatus Paceibacterota bacterium]|nr:hypothetical protein [Verrucomicrobiota bacterium]HOX02854.1 hypothetical protein [Verrucomicrobiota bacterium]HRZ45606.1 hypothetical protein [Candidatus Paceibacterota bacterium]HRZ91391.1 hypothetical protein [Candidatus Paceibacterota bacterium]